jgi:hypothetical protein
MMRTSGARHKWRNVGKSLRAELYTNIIPKKAGSRRFMLPPLARM